MNTQVSHVFFDAVLAKVTVPTVHLKGVVADIRAKLGCYFFGHGGVEGCVLVLFIEQLGSFSDNQPNLDQHFT